jgi:hypothetical protein
MKEVSFTRKGHLFGFGAKEKEAKFFVICCFFIFVGVVCINVLDKIPSGIRRKNAQMCRWLYF